MSLGRYREYHDQVWIEVDPRIQLSAGHVQLRMETDYDVDDDDYQSAYANFTKRDDLTSIIEALTFARDAVFLPLPVNASQSGLPGVPTPIDTARDEMVRQIRREMDYLSERLATWRGVRKDAADSLYQATITAIHTTTDPAIRDALQTATLEYDFVMRFGKEVA